MPENYEEKRAARIERLRGRADDKRAESNQLHESASKMASGIPFGQPILVGHHSEKRDRRYRGKIHNKFQKSHELSKEAAELDRRAETAENNRAISSDDPNAIEKLQQKLEKAEALQKRMKEANKLVRKKDKEGLSKMGFTAAQIENLFKPDFGGRIGFPSYELTNNGAEIRRIKKRIESLQKTANDVTTEKQIGEITVCDNVEENRIQIFFPGKPSEEIRTRLKSAGFRWAPSLGCWQRFRGGFLMDTAVEIAEAAEAAGDA